MKRNVLFYLLCFFTLSSNAQKIELKKGKVLLDEKEIFGYTEKNRNTEFTLFDLTTNEEVLFIFDNENQTIGYRQDDYYKINFLALKLKLESTNIKGSWKSVLKWLYENKIFDSEGKLDSGRIQIFIDKYDEKISEK